MHYDICCPCVKVAARCGMHTIWDWIQRHFPSIHPVKCLDHDSAEQGQTDDESKLFQGTCTYYNFVPRSKPQHSVGYDMPCVCDVIPILDVDNIIDVLTTQLQDLGNGALYCPRVAPTRGVVSCTYEQWFRPYSLRRCYCHLPVSGRRMQRFLQFRLGCHCLPIATGRFAGAAHVDRAQRVCLSCNAGALGDEKHLIFECTALASLRSRYAGLFTSNTDTMRSFFAQPDRMGVFHYVIDCLDFMKI